MNSKQIVYLMLILVILMTGLWVKNLYKPSQISQDLYDNLTLDFDPESIQEIDILQLFPENHVHLVKSGDEWHLPEMWNSRAQSGKIKPFLEKIRDAKGELRAEDASLFDDFKIADDEGFHVSLKKADGKPAVEFQIGAVNAGFGSSFIRKAGSDAVYLANTNLLGALGIYGDAEGQEISMNQWTDLKLLGWKNDDIMQAEFSRFKKGKPEKEFGIKRTNEVEWAFMDPSRKDLKPDKEAAGKWIRAITDWTANEILEPGSMKDAFEKPDWEIRLVSKSGDEAVLTGTQQEESDPKETVYLIKVSTEPPVFKVGKLQYQELQPTVEKLTAQAKDAAA